MRVIHAYINNFTQKHANNNRELSTDETYHINVPNERKEKK